MNEQYSISIGGKKGNERQYLIIWVNFDIAIQRVDQTRMNFSFVDCVTSVRTSYLFFSFLFHFFGTFKEGFIVSYSRKCMIIIIITKDVEIVITIAKIKLASELLAKPVRHKCSTCYFFCIVYDTNSTLTLYFRMNGLKK